MSSFMYDKSVRCSITIEQTADVEVSIVSESVVWALNPLLNSADTKPVEIGGIGNPPKKPFSISPLTISPSKLCAGGFSTLSGGEGAVHSGELIIAIYMWAGGAVSSVRLGVNNYVRATFSFGGVIAKPIAYYADGNGGTVFNWPAAV